MKQRYTILCLDKKGTTNIELTATNASLSLLFFLIFLGAAALAAVTYDYHQTQKALAANRRQLTELSSHIDTKRKQEEQIRHFSSKIEELRSSLTHLEGFREKIITLANLPDSKKVSGWSGIGGPTPESSEEAALLGHIDTPQPDETADITSQAAVSGTNIIPSSKQLFDDAYTHNILKASPVIEPVKGHAVLPFGSQPSPLDGKVRFHEGVKIIPDSDSPIVSTADGIVIFAGQKGFYGKTVHIDHGFGITTYYSHMDTISVTPGQNVKRGEAIGSIGKHAESPFHYEVRIGGLPVHPFKIGTYFSLK